MTSALLIIDMQNSLVEQGYKADKLLATVGDLHARARQAGVPVLYLRHANEKGGGSLIPGTPAWEIHPAVAPQSGDVVIDKRASDSFYGTTLDDELQARGVTHLVICGMASEQCVDMTTRSAVSHDYDVTVVADGHTTVEYPSPLDVPERIAYHNFLMGYIATPSHASAVVPSAAIRFAAGRATIKHATTT